MKILIATEGSEFSKEAVEKCCSIFKGSQNISIRIVAAAKPAVVPAEPFALSAEYIREMDEASYKQAEDIAENAEQQIRGHLPDIGARLTKHVAAGAPAQVVVDEAERWRPDLIVVGSHGYGFWKRALLGSVSSAVVHHAPCSVLVVRSPQRKSVAFPQIDGLSPSNGVSRWQTY